MDISLLFELASRCLLLLPAVVVDSRVVSGRMVVDLALAVVVGLVTNLLFVVSMAGSSVVISLTLVVEGVSTT